jgi:pimeloyl-ACP methyl ester carboxylesterase
MKRSAPHMQSENLWNLFPVGYHRLHDNVALNFQLNRFLRGARLEDFRLAASRIHNLTDWKREMLELAAQAEKEDRIENAAACYRAAEFFMLPDDPDKERAYRSYLTFFEQVTPGESYQRREAPYRGKSLPTLHLPLEDAKDTLVIHGGFDSFQEDFFVMATVLREAGYRVILFEGPGQGTALHRQGLPMIPEWEHPVSAVLDAYGIERCSLLGISLGGYLASRAAAFEPRVKRLIVLGVMYDFLECFARAGGPVLGRLLRLGLQSGADAVIDRVTTQRMRQDVLAAWGIPHGMHVMGVNRPSELFRQVSLFNTRSFSHRITQDVLLLAGAEDHYVPLRQFYQQAQLLTGARSVTGRIFTAAEHGQNHCQVGNLSLALRTIVNWLDERTGAFTPLIN